MFVYRRHTVLDHKLAIDARRLWPKNLDYGLLILFPIEEWKTSGAYFWDRYNEAEQNICKIKYLWVGASRFGDQIILTDKTIMHSHGGIYACGPDLSGPCNKKHWPESILYFGADLESWLHRIAIYGDEYSLGPADLEDYVDDHLLYRKIYRELNPGIDW